MPEWLTKLDPGKVRNWLLLIGMFLTGLFFLWSIPGDISGIRDALEDQGARQALSDSLRLRSDSIDNREHAELWLEVCIMRGLETPQELRSCLQ